MLAFAVKALSAVSMLALTTMAAVWPASAAAAASPSAAQEHAAVLKAERSRSLWATVNVCNTRAHHDQVGIRGEMPALGFPARLEMTVQLTYLDSVTGHYAPVPGAQTRIQLGTVTHGDVQDGALFRFRPTVTLQGKVTFTWSRDGRTLGSVTRATSGRHRGVADADPRGFSAATCRIAG